MTWSVEVHQDQHSGAAKARLKGLEAVGNWLADYLYI